MVNIIVPIKRVPDAASRIEIESSGLRVRADSWILNPYDEFAVEEAIRIKERFGAKVTAINAGFEGGEEVLKKAIAMGADRAVFIKDPLFKTLSGINIARVLSEAIKKMPFDIIFCGKHGTDGEAGATGAAVSAFLNIALVSSVKKLTMVPGERRAEAVREIDGANEVVECGLPALFTAARGLNLPRYPSLQGIMRAKKEEVKYLDINSLGMDPEDLSETIKVEKLYYPLRSRRNIMPGGDIKEQVEKAVKFLKEEVKVI